MTDGFFTRPPKTSVFVGRIAPDLTVIARSLDDAGIRELAAVIAVHSHYDHAMDSPEVARRTGALLVGSESTANIGRGAELPEEQIRVIVPGEPMVFGGFTVTAIRSQHFPHGHGDGRDHAAARASGARHGLPRGRKLLAARLACRRQPPDPGQRRLARRRAGRAHADVVLLGIGGLGTRDEAYREGYWNAVVGAVQPALRDPDPLGRFHAVARLAARAGAAAARRLRRFDGLPRRQDERRRAGPGSAPRVGAREAARRRSRALRRSATTERKLRHASRSAASRRRSLPDRARGADPALRGADPARDPLRAHAAPPPGPSWC